MKISDIIVEWYKKNRRNLPWRGEHDPYRIWLSEVILQQTRVEQGLAYYLRFVEQYPDLFSLAAASEQEVMKLWQGLGYYSRARNLHATAQQVVNDFGGVLPGDRISLLQLKGVGPYTASAVASIAFNEPVAVVDGNVARVLSRLFAVGEPVNSTAGQRIIRELAGELLDRENPGDFNQAIMDFGALQCIPAPKRRTIASGSNATCSGGIPQIPSIPDCAACPLQSHCMAFSRQQVHRYPVKIRKAKVKRRFFTYVVIGHNGYTYLQQRTADDIWKMMYEFPLIEHDAPPETAVLIEEVKQLAGARNGELQVIEASGPVMHQLTHRTIEARFIHVRIDNPDYTHPVSWKRIPSGKIGEYPLPRLIDRYLELHSGLTV